MKLLKHFGNLLQLTKLTLHKGELEVVPVYVARSAIIMVAPDLGDETGIDQYDDDAFANCGAVISLSNGSSIQVQEGFGAVMQMLG